MMLKPGVSVGTMICVIFVARAAGAVGLFGAAHDDREVGALRRSR